MADDIKLDRTWVEHGFFKLDAQNNRLTHTRRIRDALDPNLEIAGYPMVENVYQHTKFWRKKSATPWAMAQYVAHIPLEVPVLSLGVSVEKNNEAMNDTWDWLRLVELTGDRLAKTLDGIASEAKRPVYITIAAHHEGSDEKETTCYTVPVPAVAEPDAAGHWFRRHVGRAKPDDVMEQLRKFMTPKRQNWWVDTYFACYFSPEEVGEMTITAAALHLQRFDPLRTLVARAPDV